MGKYKKRKSSPKPRQSSTQPFVAAEVMDIRAVSTYLGIGKSKIYALIRVKKIPASRIGRQYRFSKDVIDQWLKETLITKDQGAQMSLSFENKTSGADGSSAGL